MLRSTTALVLLALSTTVACAAEPASPSAPPPAIASLQGWCAEVPRAANTALAPAPVASDWFQVVLAAKGVYAFIEPYQFQEAISYLILGTDRALLFDTGTGMVPLRPLVEKLTHLPVTVVNSHTHYDHVGGNSEFDHILAVNSPYTRANMAGFPHDELATEVAPDAFCKGAPVGLNTAAFRTRAWKAAGSIADGDAIDLGGRRIEVLQVPGHTPDAIALLDRANGLLWTGDSWYEGTLWLYVPETDLDAYERSIARLAGLAPYLKQLLPAHNTASADPSRLDSVRGAVRKMREGTVSPAKEESGGRLIFEIDGVSILTSEALLAGQTGDRRRGGSGLSVWP